MDTQRRARVVVGVSQSLAGLQALRYGTAEARRRRVPVYAVRAWQVEPTWAGPDPWRYIDGAFDLAMGGVPADIDVAVVAAEGRADVVLTGYAGYAEDLLVRGTAGRWWPSWLVRACTRQATCPVTVVPPPELARGASRAILTRRLLREAARVTHVTGRNAAGAR
ncbi:universal stress protein [Planosporangium thailandense]|uniref:Universal stress protein n=1 Tax=Planosporangium thailandense TaxID=765197 RepID=A0ABX0XZ06_9ACTN|nr:universal stress protein [Planosporangium thailandense]NJC71309.1 universal stress protein [Planosporangium thailandense]